MSSTSYTPILTRRDEEALAALDDPLTAAQMLRRSRTWRHPFESDRVLRRRMQQLARAGLVRVFRYATTTPTIQQYYTLAPEGYRLLYGHDVPVPRGAVSEIALSRQRHAFALSEFMTHTISAAYDAGCALTESYSENALKLTVGQQARFPDRAFKLRTPSGLLLSFLVEIDMGTHRLTSRAAFEHIERALRFYDALRDQSPAAFRVLYVVGHDSTDRRDHILEAAARAVRRPNRALCYAVKLPDYLAAADAITRPVFLSHDRSRRALVPESALTPHDHSSLIDKTV